MGDAVKRWLTRNALALGLLVVLVPAALFAFAPTVWIDLLTGGPNAVVTVAEGHTVERDGMVIGPVTLVVVESGAEAPEGSELAVVIVPVDARGADPDEKICRILSLAPAGEPARWSASYYSDLPWDSYEHPAGCPADVREATLAAGFTIPARTEGPFDVEVVLPLSSTTLSFRVTADSDDSGGGSDGDG